MQNSIDCGPTPLPNVPRRRYPIQRELLGNLTNRQILLHVAVEDPPYDDSFGFLYFGMSRDTITTGNLHVTVGHIRRKNLSATRAVELAAPISFRNLGPLELGDGSRDLMHQLRKRIVRRSTLKKNRLHSEPFQLIQDQGLQHKLACQSIRAVGQQHFKTATFRQIPHPVQGGTIQPRAAVAFVGEFLDDFQPVFRRVCAQGL